MTSDYSSFQRYNIMQHTVKVMRSREIKAKSKWVPATAQNQRKYCSITWLYNKIILGKNAISNNELGMKFAENSESQSKKLEKGWKKIMK